MSLHDRIMALEPNKNTAIKVGMSKNTKVYDAAFQDGIISASKVAKEADDLMLEMAEVLAAIAVEQEGTHAGLDADFVLTKYFMWKEASK